MQRTLLAFTLAVLTSCATIPPTVSQHRSHLKQLEDDGLTMAYLDEGPREAEAIVLLHGLPTSSYLYRDIVPVLTAAGYRVIAPDLIGFGASSKPTDASAFALEAQARRVTALLEVLHVTSFTLVVHDLGGPIGWELLDDHPERVARLMVLNTTAYEPFNPPSEMKMLGGAMGEMMSGMMAGSAFGPGAVASFVRSFTATPGAITDDEAKAYWWPLHEGGTEPMVWMAQRFDTFKARFPRYQQALRKFTGPASLVWGAHDPVLSFDALSPQFAKDLRIPPERVRKLADASHFVQEDAADQVSAAIVELMHLAAR
ncbi:MAG: alpha/beta fold hydrolase [Myxococcales bacterium]|nr:alpha/beta fold hydrolase [Myxococcales bacterium]